MDNEKYIRMSSEQLRIRLGIAIEVEKSFWKSAQLPKEDFIKTLKILIDKFDEEWKN